MSKEVQLYALKSDIKSRHLGQPGLLANLARIRKETGKSPFRVMLDWAPLYRKPMRMRFDEYLQFRLYDSERFSAEDKKRFVSEAGNNELWLKANDISWISAAEDKWLMYSILERHGIPVPRTVGIVSTGWREFGSIPTIGNATEFVDFFQDRDGSPAFLKPVKGVGSSGAHLILGVSGGSVSFENGRMLPLDQFFSEEIETDAYLIQDVVENHHQLSKLSSHLPTVRCYNFLTDGEVFVAASLMKLCSTGNIADNFWRTGNMLAGVDVESGHLTKVIRGTGFDREELEYHPDTGVRFGDFTIPHWENVCEINRTCARMFPGLLFSSTDIAITDNGPVVIEVNNGGAVNLPQLIYETGFMTDRAARFFEEAATRS